MSRIVAVISASGMSDKDGVGELVASGTVTALRGLRNDEVQGVLTASGTITSGPGVAALAPHGDAPLTASGTLSGQGARTPPYGQGSLTGTPVLFGTATPLDIILNPPPTTPIPPDPIDPDNYPVDVAPPLIDPKNPPVLSRALAYTPAPAQRVLPPCPPPLTINQAQIDQAASGDVQSIVTKEWHVWWGGVLLGWSPGPYDHCGNVAQWSLTDLSGWLGLPDSDAADTDRASRWGAFPGLQTFNARTIEATFTYTGYGDAVGLRTIRQALQPQEDPQEQPLIIWSGTQRPEFVMARVNKAAIPTDQQFSMGYQRITVSWTATDPVRYGEILHTDSCALANPVTSGLHFYAQPLGLRFPLSFSGGGGGGQLLINNTGVLNVWPNFTITGPVQAPRIEFQGAVRAGKPVGPARVLQFSSALNLTAGQTLTIDTDNRFAQITGADVPPLTAGAGYLLSSREWFPLPPGMSQLRFAADRYSPSARLTATWRDAAIL
jgi:hypothetical protein